MSILPQLKEDKNEIIENIITHYIQNRENYTDLLKDYSEKLESMLESKIHSVIFRVKKPDSLRKKILKKIDHKEHYKTICKNNYMQIVTDLGGVRILLLRQTNWRYIDKVIQELGGCEIIEKIAYLPSDMYEADKEGFKSAGFETPADEKKQYSSIHYTIKINYKSFDYYIEVQVRSLAEEQFAEIEHEIRYKSSSNYDAMTSSTLRNLSRAAGVMNYLSFQAYNHLKEAADTGDIQKEFVEFDIQLLIKNISHQKNCPQLLKFLKNDLNVEFVLDNVITLSTSSPILLSQANDTKIINYLIKYLNKNMTNKNYVVEIKLRNTILKNKETI
jgi:ppGpp synthetase/RelA/SpoT-type nucleotidyltranferase